MVGAVVFDMDGVILDSEQLVVRSWQKIAGKYGIENIEGFCMAALGLNREAAKKLFVRMYDGRYGDEERYEVLKAEMASEFPCGGGWRTCSQAWSRRYSEAYQG